ncbi:MAG: response regulator [Candidatus Omnitrophica bacterium]|nr:response regulator [Candidatus Omnitrophota bacterium]
MVRKLKKETKKKILIVDDDRIICDSLQELLSDEYEVDTVYNGKEAMSAILLEKPDLVIIDVNMPHLDGVAVVEHILSDFDNEKIKFILISGYLTDDVVEEWRKVSRDSLFFAKPFDIKKLRHGVRTLLLA